MATEVQWNELARDPKSVAALADADEVVVRRRDGATLILQREDRVKAGAQGALSAARALRSAFVHMPPEEALQTLRDEFPWVDVFDRNDLMAFMADFIRAVQASADLGQWGVLEQALHEWRATARIANDPVLAKRLLEPITEDLGPVPAPYDVSGT